MHGEAARFVRLATLTTTNLRRLVTAEGQSLPARAGGRSLPEPVRCNDGSGGTVPLTAHALAVIAIEPSAAGPIRPLSASRIRSRLSSGNEARYAGAAPCLPKKGVQ